MGLADAIAAERIPNGPQCGIRAYLAVANEEDAADFIPDFSEA